MIFMYMVIVSTGGKLGIWQVAGTIKLRSGRDLEATGCLIMFSAGVCKYSRCVGSVESQD